MRKIQKSKVHGFLVHTRVLTLSTGGSAAAAADLVNQLKGQVVGYLFILEIPGLNGRDKLSGAPTTILL
jgi:adenine phosphoribosyltransferase